MFKGGSTGWYTLSYLAPRDSGLARRFLKHLWLWIICLFIRKSCKDVYRVLYHPDTVVLCSALSKIICGLKYAHWRWNQRKKIFPCIQKTSPHSKVNHEWKLPPPPLTSVKKKRSKPSEKYSSKLLRFSLYVTWHFPFTSLKSTVASRESTEEKICNKKNESLISGYGVKVQN